MDGSSEQELVSVIVPCFNEAAAIAGLLEGILAQTYPVGKIEVVIADGMSTDATRNVISAFVIEHPELKVRIVDNVARKIPAGLNVALKAGVGEFFVRMDGHSRPNPEYVQTCVSDLKSGLGMMVGGVCDIRPRKETWVAKAIAVATSHPVGVGDAYYRFAKQARVVDTLAFWAIHRSVPERIGYFDESLESNEDYEFNYRVRKSGGKIWLDPSISSIYYPQASFGGLAKQYWRYGFWKTRMLARFPETLRIRQFLPPAALVLGGGLTIGGILLPVLAKLLCLLVALYGGVLLGAGCQSAFRRKDAALIYGFPMAVMVMHFSWASAFLFGLISNRRKG